MSSRSPEWELWEISGPGQHPIYNTPEDLYSYHLSSTSNDVECTISDDSQPAPSPWQPGMTRNLNIVELCSPNDWYNYHFYSQDSDDEYTYTLEDLKHLDKETRESIIDYTVEDTFDIATEIVELLNLQRLIHNNFNRQEEEGLTSNLLKQFRRIMNLD
jgi:hypothetical protein